MKLDTTKISLIIAVLVLLWLNFFKSDHEIKPIPVTVKVAKIVGKTGIVNIEPQVERDTVYIKGNTIEVDKGYKRLYETAKDTISKYKLYLEAIKINTYRDTIVNNEDIIIEGEATTRGALLNYSIDYTIKEKEVKYTPKVISKFPRVSVGLGLDLGVPTTYGKALLTKVDMSLMNSRGREISLGYDTSGRLWIGGKINIKLIR